MSIGLTCLGLLRGDTHKPFKSTAWGAVSALSLTHTPCWQVTIQLGREAPHHPSHGLSNAPSPSISPFSLPLTSIHVDSLKVFHGHNGRRSRFYRQEINFHLSLFPIMLFVLFSPLLLFSLIPVFVLTFPHFSAYRSFSAPTEGHFREYRGLRPA